MQRLWNALVAAAFNAVGNSLYAPFFALIDLLYRWGLGGAPALYVDCVDASNLAGTYANGASGVGATLTKSSAGAFPTIDGVTPFVGMRVFLPAQSTPAQGGLYRLTTLGGTVAWQLTRDTAWDQSAEMKAGSLFYVKSGTTYGGSVWAYTGASAPTVGTDPLTFAQDSLVRTAVAAAYTAVQSFANGTLKVIAASGGKGTIIDSAAAASDKTATFPNATGNVMLDASADAITGVKSFADGKLEQANVAGDHVTIFHSSATADRSLSLPDHDGEAVVQLGGKQALSGAGAANVTTDTTECTSSGAGQVVTLANGSFDKQWKTIIAVSGQGGGNTTVVTPANPAAFATATLAAVGQSVVLQWNATLTKWIPIACTGTVA